MKGFLWITFASATLFLYTDEAKGCSVVRVSQVDPAIEVVQGSAVIVRAEAVGYVTESESRTGILRFSVSEVLRGNLAIAVGFTLLAIDHVITRDKPWLIGTA